MELEIYFGVPPLFFVSADSSGIEVGTNKGHINKMVERYHRRWRSEAVPCGSDDAVPKPAPTKDELEAMVCQDGQWYANKDELEKAMERKRRETERQPWAIPDWMLEPKPRKRRVRPQKHWIV
jgi:hypothetical protein